MACKTKLAGAAGAMAVLALTGLPATATPTHQVNTASRSCLQSAARQSLTGSARHRFLTRCMKVVATSPTVDNRFSENAVASPSGQLPAQRSADCAREAARRQLGRNARQEFQHSCIANAGPVVSTGTTFQPPAHRAAKPGLGVVVNGEQH